MNVNLRVIAVSVTISILMGCSYAQAKKLHDSQVETANRKVVVPLYKYQGNADLQNSSKYQFFVNLEELDYFPAYEYDGQRRTEMTPEHLDIIWEKMVQELPEGTRFSIEKATTVAKISTVEVYLDSSVAEKNLSRGNFIFDYRKGELVKFGVQPETPPKLKEYVDLEKWDKKTAFNLTQKHLLEKHPVARVTLVFEASLNEGDSDYEYYKTVLSRAGTSTSKSDIMTLSDGVLAVEVLTDINGLQALYDEQKIINIIPDLPEN